MRLGGIDLLCPYCNAGRSCSDDHVFAAALGGRRTIRACVDCNSRFGHTFEAKALADLVPLQLMLSQCGVPLHRPLTWRRALVDPRSGEHLDLLPAGHARLSRPVPIIDEEGRVTILRMPDRRTAEWHAKRLLKKRKAASVKI